MGLRITHFAPFAPLCCGLYEAARDMVRADSDFGHKVRFVDVGRSDGASRSAPAAVGSVDDRAGFKLVTSAWEEAINDSDVMVQHDGVQDNWLVRCQTPIVWVIHGRPLACYRGEYLSKGASQAYSVVPYFSKWPRVKFLTYFWPEFTPFWRQVVSEKKLRCVPDPVCDFKRFKPSGVKFPIPDRAPEDKRELRGEWNLMIADSWRDDVDIFEVTNGAIEAVKRIPGLKIHFWAVEPNRMSGMEPLFGALRELKALGQVYARVGDMDEHYRSMDLVLTPNRIATRIVAEALCCGVPVVAGRGCTYTPWTAPPDEPEAVAKAIGDCIEAIRSTPDNVKVIVRENAAKFDPQIFAGRMNQVYTEAMEA